MRLEGELPPLAAKLSRRTLMRYAGAGALAALVAPALPVAREILAAAPAEAMQLPAADATLQAFADTIVPGRRASVTDLGNVIHPGAIAGVDDDPGAVEADALALFHSPFTGFDLLQAAFLADLERRAVAQQHRPFLTLSYPQRVAVAERALSFSNRGRPLYEVGAAISFSAFCLAAANPNQTAARASGYRAIRFPGAAPRGYRHDGYTYGRKLARERTRKGYLP
jgi:hypothetical protein